jgi:predicted methyltransferase
MNLIKKQMSDTENSLRFWGELIQNYNSYVQEIAVDEYTKAKIRYSKHKREYLLYKLKHKRL